MLHFLREDSEEDIGGDRVLVLGLLHEGIVGLDRTLLTLDILFQHLDDERIIGSIIPAVGQFEPLLGVGDRGPAELDDTGGEQGCMSEFFGCMEGEFGNNCFLVGPLDDLGANPVPVVGKPFIGECLVERVHEILDIGIDNFSS